MKLIQNNLYLLLVNEEAEILCRNKEILLSKDESLLCEVTETNHRQHFRGLNIASNIEVAISYHQTDDFYKVVAYYPLTKEAKELDLPVLPPFENDKGLEKSLNKYIKDLHSQEECIGFIDGYKAAQQSNKQFSLENMKKAFIAGQKHGEDVACSAEINLNPNLKEYLQSLSTQQLPKEFLIQKEYWEYNENQWKDVVNNYSLKGSSRRLKTITNSDGKEELVGTWKY